VKVNIEQFLQNYSVDTFLPILIEKQAVNIYNLTHQEVVRIGLKNGLTPLRYKRNKSTISVENQLKLLNSHVAIIGCGGLGGHVAEILTRIGVGKLTLFDFDIFEEHNINRQNFSNYNTLGKEKVLVVKKALKTISPSLHVDAFVKKFEPKNDIQNLVTDVVVDALDNPDTKLELSLVCKDKNIAFVHGAIAGMTGQFSTNNTLENLYRNSGSGVENSVGNPAFSVTFAASLQSSEVIKILLNIGIILKNHILMTNLLENEFTPIPR